MKQKATSQTYFNTSKGFFSSYSIYMSREFLPLNSLSVQEDGCCGKIQNVLTQK